MNDELIKTNVLKLQNAGATPDDIENYVKLAIQERESLIQNQVPQNNQDLLQKAGNITNTIFPGEQVGKVLGTLGGYALTALKEKLGLVPKGTTDAYDLSAPTPLQVSGDIAKEAAMIGGLKAPIPIATSLLGKIGQGALIGAKIGALAGGGQTAINTSNSPIPTRQDIGKVAAGTGIGAGAGAFIGGLTTGLGALVEKAGNKIINFVIKPSQADIKDGFTMNTIKKYDLGGSLPSMMDKTEARMNDLTHQLNSKLAGSDSSINLQDVFNDTVSKLKGNKLSNFGANTSQGKALEQLQGEISAIGGKEPISIPDAQIIKRAAGHFGAWQYGAFDPESTARETIYNTFYNQMKIAIEKNSPPGVKEINKQLQELIPVSNAIIRRIPVAARNNALSLGDLITLTAGALNPHALGAFVLSLASKSGTAGNLLSKYAGPAIQHVAPLISGLSGLGASKIMTSEQSPPSQ